MIKLSNCTELESPILTREERCKHVHTEQYYTKEKQSWPQKQTQKKSQNKPACSQVISQMQYLQELLSCQKTEQRREQKQTRVNAQKQKKSKSTSMCQFLYKH